MKNRLLFTIAFFGVITFASAQTLSISFDKSDSLTFTVGQQATDDLNDAAMVTVGGSGLVSSNNKFFGIKTTDTTQDDATGAFTFELTTLSTTAIDAILTLDMAKRPGCSVKGKISVTGYDDLPFSALSDGTDSTQVQELRLEFGTISLIDNAPLTVTVTLEEMLNVDNTSTPIFRMENVILEKENSLSDIGEMSSAADFNLFPNPVSNSFQINADEVIDNVRLFNTTGRLIKTFNNVKSYDISDIASGMYIVNVKTQSGSKVLSIVKQ